MKSCIHFPGIKASLKEAPWATVRVNGRGHVMIRTYILGSALTHNITHKSQQNICATILKLVTKEYKSVSQRKLVTNWGSEKNRTERSHPV